MKLDISFQLNDNDSRLWSSSTLKQSKATNCLKYLLTSYNWNLTQICTLVILRSHRPQKWVLFYCLLLKRCFLIKCKEEIFWFSLPFKTNCANINLIFGESVQFTIWIFPELFRPCILSGLSEQNTYFYSLWLWSIQVAWASISCEVPWWARE